QRSQSSQRRVLIDLCYLCDLRGEILPRLSLQPEADVGDAGERDRQLAADGRFARERADGGSFGAIVEVVREQDGGDVLQERRGVRVAEEHRDERMAVRRGL